MKQSFSRLIIGMFILALGLGFLLSSLNLYDFAPYAAKLWPVTIMVVGLAMLIANPRRWVWPLAVTAFGGLLLARQFDLVTFNVWNVLWPSALMLLGLSILFKRGHDWGAPQDADSDKLDATAIFSGQTLHVTSHKFVGGDATAVFGGVELDLRDAKIDGRARLEVNAVLGGIDIKVPESWRVQVSATPIFGGVDDRTRKPSDSKNAPTLVIEGACVFGGVSVKN